MKLDDEVCFCFHISKRKIINYLRIHNVKRASQLSECGGAGTGCGWCVAYLKKYFAALESGDISADEDMSSEAHAQGRSTYLEEGRGTPPS